MKQFFLVSLLMLMISSLSAQTETAIKETQNAVLDVYYTHSTNRCAGCRAIEKETLETLNSQFKQQMENGEIAVHIVNIDLKKNKEIVDEFEVWGSSLFIVKNGDTKNRTDLTKEGFAMARTKPEEFRAVVAKTIKEQLN
ncbi:MAG: nitrophenyl compound nitroreductase subunit ArsF family protein [Bacteroidales bacterium]